MLRKEQAVEGGVDNGRHNFLPCSRDLRLAGVLEPYPLGHVPTMSRLDKHSLFMFRLSPN